MIVEPVASAFASYRANVLPTDAPAVQVDECRRAFYAGAYFLLMNIAHNIGDDSTTEEQGIEQLEQLRGELERYGRDVGQELSQPAAPPLVVPDVNYTTPDAATMRPILQALGDRISGALPHGWGFNLLLFTFGEDGSLFYISNAERADVMNVMREYIKRSTQ